ncbi:MAG TPA: hypothetical protein VLK84_20090 [Longimicrobium sp.]|nr:hypothetical protein [Longimicrobium sp.]
MKKSTAIRLTLVSSLAMGATACAERQPEGPQQSFKGYCDPADENRCESQPRAGYYPMFIPLYYGGYYYDSRGTARTRPGGPVARNAPASQVSRGGFGRTGVSRGGGYT